MNNNIASELKCAMLYDTKNHGAVKRIHEITGLALPTIYDYLDGKIKTSLDFLYAAVIATDGDPRIKKFLEPKGWRLVPDGSGYSADKATLAEECLDDIPALAAFHAELNRPGARLDDIERARSELIREITENVEFWKSKNRA